jgi:hypothetical protein
MWPVPLGEFYKPLWRRVTTMLSSRAAPGEIALSINNAKPFQLAVRGLLQRYVVRIIFILQ